MTIAARFDEALEAVAGRGLDGPELLPERLARAAAAMLPVDAAGLSLLASGDERVPLGASGEVAATAERLQFTVGDGPCMAAQQTGEPVFAAEEDLRRRWPAYTARLHTRTPYRAIVGLPLTRALSGIGAVDLYFERSEAIAGLDVFEAIAVGELITDRLTEAAVFSTWDAAEGPDWLHAPAARRRAAVWEAAGRLDLELAVGGPTALALMRSHATATGTSVDEVAADVLERRLRPGDLRAPGTPA